MAVVRQNFHTDSEALLNKQINWELRASYTYRSMSAFFARDDQALHGFSRFFSHQSKEESDHADALIAYQNTRGGRVVFQDVQRPVGDNTWVDALGVVQTALELEKNLNGELLNLHKVAGGHGDPHLSDFLESHFLDSQVESIKALGDLITKMKRVGEGVGLHILDQELFTRYQS